MKKHLTATTCAWIIYVALVILVCFGAGFLAKEANAEPTVCGVDGSNNLITANLTLMPYVDKTKNCTPLIGASDLRVKPTKEQPTNDGKVGAFRVECFTSHMANDDPIVYPGQPGKSHHHTFFGNTTTNANSDLMDFANVGNSTCKGGIMNRSAYWVPSMIDTTNGTPIKPDKAIFYYKTGGLPPGNLVVPPKGLRMISGNAGAKTVDESSATFTCIRKGNGNSGWTRNIPACNVGETMQMMVGFPQCWDGVNLDSPDHKSHMAYTVPRQGKCPATHPIGLPQITLGLNFVIVDGNQTAKWRLASDNYFSGLPAGYSAHADWVNGWDESIMTSIVKNCLNAAKDCHAHLLGDGRMFFGGVIK